LSSTSPERNRRLKFSIPEHCGVEPRTFVKGIRVYRQTLYNKQFSRINTWNPMWWVLKW